MTPQEVATVLQTLFVLAVGWILIFWLWRSLLVDSLRQNLFVLRAELFDYAAVGHIRFEDFAYAQLRGRLNGLIRFAHEVSFINLLLLLAKQRLWPNPSVLLLFEEWKRGLNQLESAEARQKLQEIEFRMGLTVAKNLIAGSPLLVCCLAVFAAARVLQFAAKRIFDGFARMIPGMDLLEAHAVQVWR